MRWIVFTLNWWRRWCWSKFCTCSSFVPFNHSRSSSLDDLVNLLRAQSFMSYTNLLTPGIWLSFEFVRTFLIKSLIKCIKNGHMMSISCLFRNVILILLFFNFIFILIFNSPPLNNIKFFLYLIKTELWKCCLLSRVRYVCELNFIFCIQSLNFLEDFEWIMLYRLLKSHLKYFFINYLYNKIKILHHTLMMFFNLLLFLVVFYHRLIKFFLGFISRRFFFYLWLIHIC